MPIQRPIRQFTLCFLPGAALAFALAALARPHLPDYAAPILLASGFAAFIAAILIVAGPGLRAGAGRDRAAPVLALLRLRRHRGRYAAAFSLMATFLAEGGLTAMTAAGLAPPLETSAGHVALTAVLLTIAAWLMLGQAACSNAAIRRALLPVRQRRP